MWSLVYAGDVPVEPNTASKKHIRLLCGTDYIVGRKAADIVLTDDPSISRKHAALSVKHDEKELTNSTYIPVLSITDYSKFGTQVDGRKLSGGSCSLSHGNVIKFGQLQNTYRVEYKPLRVAVSSLSGDDKTKLKECLLQLGGLMAAGVNGEFDLLVMGKVGITVKAVCALASLKPVVTVDYFTSLLAAIKSKDSLPSLQSFTPQLPEQSSDKNLLDANSQRRILFSGMTFFFCSKSQFERMKIPVQLAGGTALLLESRPRSLSQLTTPGSILMYCDAKQQPSWYKDCSTHLTRWHMRYIQDAEIGHAVLYCSTEKHCNPQQDAGSKLHEEFSQKALSNQCMTQKVSQAFGGTQKSMAPLSTATGVLVPDSQVSKSLRLEDRSLPVAEDILPPPDVTSVTMQEPVLPFKLIKSEYLTPNKRKSDVSSDVSSAAARKSSKMDSATPCLEQPSASNQDTNEETMQPMEITAGSCVMQETSSQNVVNPSETNDLSLFQGQDSGCDVSVVKETQPSPSSNTPVADIIKTERPIKSEIVDRLASTVTSQPCLEMEQLSEAIIASEGDSWNNMQVDYQRLFRKTCPPVFEQGDPNERDGMAFWKGKWVLNYKRFKKCGKKNLAHLPTIIGGGDLIDGLCSQPDSDNFIRMPSHEESGQRETVAPQLMPRRNVIKSSIFGDWRQTRCKERLMQLCCYIYFSQWELPRKK
ncbi:nibrin-like isoform X2 [Watersipora subatra]|uniref:nibrin-like isoform X2 n=1 Tax=Watersipora subatra TaxID=2589382 RepID=UPI00355BB5B9